MRVSRRKFIASSAVASTGLLLSSFTNLAKPIMSNSQSGYSLLIFATNWGFSGSWDEFCAKAKSAGYDGAEIWWPSEEKERAQLFEAFKKYNLKIGFLIGSGDIDFAKHEGQFKQAAMDAAKAKPVYINCHSGKDYFTAEQKEKLIYHTIRISTDTGVPIYHETHRGRALYSAPVTAELMKKIPGLRLTLDISHWCNVHESYLGDQEETIALSLSRTDHIHARIGHPEGPQVSDPRAPEWSDAVKTHFNWWDTVVERKKKEGKPMTFLTEFGPPDYMPTLPYTRQAVANQWEINVHILDVLRKRYA
jgi:sugar phosphate isomerase/epimerase